MTCAAPERSLDAIPKNGGVRIAGATDLYRMTDYDFPPMWGRMTDEQKHEWFVRERVRRQAERQDL